MQEKTLEIPSEQLSDATRLLKTKKVDYDKEQISKYSVVYRWTVKFDDGASADIRVCSDSRESGYLWSEMVVYDSLGREIGFSEPESYLAGEWVLICELEDGAVQTYCVVVKSDKHNSLYESLDIVRDDMCTMIKEELEDGITTEYSDKITDAIAEAVAEDISTSADKDGWSRSDVRLAIGRVLLRNLRVSV